MLLSNLIKSSVRTKKRVGRGGGSGKGFHTSGRGQKGQNSRNSTPIWFEGGQLPLIRRTPFIKGKLRNKSFKPQPIVVKLEALNAFKAGSDVTIESISETLKLDLKDLKYYGVKILNQGKLEKSIILKVPHSDSVAKAVTEAGGKLEA